MSQSAVVAVAVAFIVNGVLSWAMPMMSLPMEATTAGSFAWIISGVVAFAAGWATMSMGKK